MFKYNVEKNNVEKNNVAYAEKQTNNTILETDEQHITTVKSGPAQMGGRTEENVIHTQNKICSPNIG